MSDSLLVRIDRTLEAARAAGALQPIRTEQLVVPDGGFDFTVRWVSSLARKDSARVDAAIRRDPDFNPFLPPDPQLTVGPLGADHLAVLNKFPVLARHLLIVTRAFEEQTAPLTAGDFVALAQVMCARGGLGFYNGGIEAGASQRHKHLQWIPDLDGAASLRPFVAALADDLPAQAVTTHPSLPWRHRFVRLPDFGSADAAFAGKAIHEAFASACHALGIAPESGPMPPYNLLVGQGWLVVIPRRCERSEGISVNALGFAGSLFVRRQEEIQTVRRIGPLRLLATVARSK